MLSRWASEMYQYYFLSMEHASTCLILHFQTVTFGLKPCSTIYIPKLQKLFTPHKCQVHTNFRFKVRNSNPVTRKKTKSY